MKTLLMAAAIGVVSLASLAHAEPGGVYGRSKVYDIGNPGHLESSLKCKDMPCCKGMSEQEMKDMDCASMDCSKMEQGACKKMLKANKK
ncbi:MAG: hypothetical protein DI628_00335 [Blastochloris viridis]|uniref:Uncharacterized protein n=1 Tax=Blastochloris viridis TaxID=1079 RepID=A0A6N4RAK2_BLAVI|nr:MAG: hypothetical protein DI628_00335 [Blastochloris viridis]